MSERERLMIKCPTCKNDTWSYLYSDQITSDNVEKCSGCCECKSCGHQFDWAGKQLMTKGVKGWKKGPAHPNIEPNEESI